MHAVTAVNYAMVICITYFKSFIREYSLMHTPCTLNSEEVIEVPRRFATVQVYIPESSDVTIAIVSVLVPALEVVILTRSTPSLSTFPSNDHVIMGVGIPSYIHWIM